MILLTRSTMRLSVYRVGIITGNQIQGMSSIIIRRRQQVREAKISIDPCNTVAAYFVVNFSLKPFLLTCERFNAPNYDPLAITHAISHFIAP